MSAAVILVLMRVDEALVEAARALAESRYAGDPDGDGWAGAAAMYASDGRILTSVFVDSPNAAASLCCETGAIAEAHKLGLGIVASVCVSRERPDEPFVILTPCGICQERLAHWGGDVQVGVPRADDPTRWASLPLREVQPYYWAKVLTMPEYAAEEPTDKEDEEDSRAFDEAMAEEGENIPWEQVKADLGWT